MLPALQDGVGGEEKLIRIGPERDGEVSASKRYASQVEFIRNCRVESLNNITYYYFSSTFHPLFIHFSSTFHPLFFILFFVFCFLFFCFFVFCFLFFVFCFLFFVFCFLFFTCPQYPEVKLGAAYFPPGVTAV